MKVLLERRWERHINCCGCSSYLRIDQDDLRMTKDETVHVVCMVCDTKTNVSDAPEYVLRKLKNLLEEKGILEVDTKQKKDED